jgi:hypothetical protein
MIDLLLIHVTSVPQSYQIKQEEVLEESKEMADRRTWLETFSHEALQKLLQM